MIMDKEIHFVSIASDGKEVKTYVDGYLRSTQKGYTWGPSNKEVEGLGEIGVPTRKGSFKKSKNVSYLEKTGGSIPPPLLLKSKDA